MSDEGEAAASACAASDIKDQGSASSAIRCHVVAMTNGCGPQATSKACTFIQAGVRHVGCILWVCMASWLKLRSQRLPPCGLIAARVQSRSGPPAWRTRLRCDHVHRQSAKK